MGRVGTQPFWPRRSVAMGRTFQPGDVPFSDAEAIRRAAKATSAFRKQAVGQSRDEPAGQIERNGHRLRCWCPVHLRIPKVHPGRQNEAGNASQCSECTARCNGALCASERDEAIVQRVGGHVASEGCGAEVFRRIEAGRCAHARQRPHSYNVDARRPGRDLPCDLMCYVHGRRSRDAGYGSRQEIIHNHMDARRKVLLRIFQFCVARLPAWVVGQLQSRAVEISI